MAKQPKKPQTDYTRGGRDISNTAIPLYQNTLQQIADYNNDPTAAIDMYQQKYFTNTPQQSDFIRNYQESMGNMTANNYAATSGGYSSANQQNYDDYQRYYNRLAAELQAEGVAKSAAMAQQGYNNLLNATPVYRNAYGLGKEYSDVEQYNDMVDQMNSNWLGNLVGGVGNTIGTVAGASGNPLVAGIGGAIGGAMGTAGNMMTVSPYLDSAQGSGASYGQYGAGNQGALGLTGNSGLANLLSNYSWFSNNPFVQANAENAKNAAQIAAQSSTFKPSFSGYTSLF